MGTFKKGILGGFSGKVGTVIGSSWRGLDVMRSLPKKSGLNPTQQQLEQRQKFAIAMGFLKPLTSILSIYYGNVSGTSSRLNNAVSYHLKEAVTGIGPNFGIDYAKVLVSKGEMIGAKDGAATAIEAGAVQITWADNSGQVMAEAGDLLLVVIYNSDRSEYVIDEGSATRQSATAAIAIPVGYAGETLHAWLSFVNTAQKKAASSVYLGSLQAI